MENCEIEYKENGSSTKCILNVFQQHKSAANAGMPKSSIFQLQLLNFDYKLTCVDGTELSSYSSVTVLFAFSAIFRLKTQPSPP